MSIRSCLQRGRSTEHGGDFKQRRTYRGSAKGGDGPFGESFVVLKGDGKKASSQVVSLRGDRAGKRPAKGSLEELCWRGIPGAMAVCGL